MKKIKKIILLVLCGISVYSTFAIVNNNNNDADVETDAEETGEELIFPISKKDAHSLDEKPAPIDLKDPDNITTSVDYDPTTGHYILRTKLGNEDLDDPLVLDADEYMQYTMQRSMNEYWRQKGLSEDKRDSKFDLTDMQFNIGKADKIFGPGGVQVKTQGSAELSFGFRKQKTDNPTWTERARNPPPSFDFDEKIQISVRGSVGDKINLAMNYNTEASFDFDQKMLKLGYEGKEDEILQKLEVGNVSMPLSSTLIRGSSALFGIKTQLKFGKLTIDGVISQQESETKTVSMKNGAQTTAFEINVDSYDENRHFFLSNYFHDNYDKAMSTLPYINSPVKINRIEVWVTNKRGNFEQARNIVAFSDLGEVSDISNPIWGGGTGRFPTNNGNLLYTTVTDTTSFFYNNYTIRNNTGVVELLENKGIEGVEEYEKIESARLLNSSEYSINYQLGYISLRASLNPDEVLAVAYEYTANGQTFQVGEFSTDISAPKNLVVKLLKSTDLSPDSPVWPLMMKNIYSIGGYQIQSDKFEMNVMYQSDSTGVYLNYLPNTPIADKTLLSVMNLDRLDDLGESRPDGFFDYVEGYTIDSSTGRIIFPVVEPFGSHLRKKFGGDTIYNKYIFDELYTMTLTSAQENTEKNKFRLKGRYKGSSGSEIRLNAMNVPRGSVTVTAGGVTLVENSDYTVDYTMGIVNIISSQYLDAGTPINVSLENQSHFNTQRKTLLGTHLDYAFNENFNIGGTIMHLSEKPLTQKVTMGSEPISNTIWGLNTSYRTQSQWLTNVLDKIPLLNLKEPSSIALNAEFAQLVPGHAKVINNYAYIDDFESTKIGIDLRYPQYWKLASTPANNLFPEAKITNDVSYGYNRALLAWYYVDPIFTNPRSNLIPAHLKNDKDQLSNHFVRQIKEEEIFPNRERVYGQPETRTVLNLSFYPEERGPYNLDYNGMTVKDGKLVLTNPAKRWGGIMRSISQSDFEASNIEYIEFWMMDPFVYNENNTMKGGELYFNLGNISEDILKDGKKFFEDGLPIDGDTTKIQKTKWGHVPLIQSMVAGFQNTGRALQDVGLNGLTDEQERQYGDYKTFVDKVREKLSPSEIALMEDDSYSPLMDPGGDNYHYYRGSDFDRDQVSILERYKRYNGTQGNSPENDESPESYNISAHSVPDREDINDDNTLNEYERFYEYRIPLRPDSMQVGQGFIVNMIESEVQLENDTREKIKWYQFKVPIHGYSDRIGSIRNFKSIRFMRMFLTGFEEETHLRFASLELVRGEWRNYTKDVRYDVTETPSSTGVLDVSSVNIEEHASKQPVRYVLPPGVSRVVDPSQTQIRQENEQSMVLKITDLAPRDGRAVYKNLAMDMRQYKRLQMFVHAEQLIDDDTDLTDGQLTVFIRLGSDHVNNFYEYEIPLKLTPHGNYNPNSSADVLAIWPKDNMFDFAFEKLTDAKNERNRLRNNGSSGISLNKPFFKYDEDKRDNKITVMGNPSISEVQVIMIGIRNQSNAKKSGEIWVNELRLSEFNEEGGYAALANMVVNLSDLGTVTVSGRTESAGFGGIEQKVQERNLDDIHQMNFATGLELGKFFPEKAKIRMPFYYSYTRDVLNPKYNPLDQDILLQDAIDNVVTKSQRDSIKSMSQDVTVNKSLSFSNVKVDIQSKNPQFYDPANFSFGYAFNELRSRDPETEYEVTKTHKGMLAYNFSTNPKPFEPFAKMKIFNSKYLKLIKDFNVNYMPSYLSYTNNINRYYYELQTKDLTGAGKLDPSFKQNFTWDRNFDIKYDFSRSLKFTFSTATNSRIDEPYHVVNKDLYPDEYQHWKDSVWSNVFKGGRAVQYQQVFNADYNVPLNKIPMLNWVTLRGQYGATYNWERGVVTTIEDSDEIIDLGNTVNNLRNWQIDGRLNMETLYKKSSYLSKIDSKFSGRRPATKTPQQPKTYNQRVTLKAGEKTEIKHRLNSTNFEFTATDAEGNNVPVKYKKVDANTIAVTSKSDVENVDVKIVTIVKPENFLTNSGQGLVRMLMLVRNVSGTYKETNSLTLPGYRPSTGFIGQDKFDGLRAPGYDFVFGFYDNEKYIKKAQDNHWLITNDTIGNPVTINKTTDLQLRASIEPIRNFKIELNATRATSESQSIQFFNNEPIRTFSGTFSMTQVAIGTSMWKIGNSGNFDSEAFDNFLRYRSTMANRIEDEYISHGDNKYNGIDLNSADVLIPAFLAAYTNRKPSSSTLDIFPSLKKLLPNWRVSYTGLTNIEFLKKYFRSISLNHQYRCIYNVGSYSSLLTWQAGNNGYYGYTTSVTDPNAGMTVLSSQYNVGSVTITESFSPLLGVDFAMKNNLSFKLEYKKSRTLGLNIASSQLVESSNNEWVIGAGYKIQDFNTILKIKQRQNSVKNDLTLRGDLSIKDVKAIIRKIEENYSQPTSGSKGLTLRLTADYVFSEKVNLGLYYDRTTNTPFISSSYPTVSTDFGVTFRFLLTR